MANSLHISTAGLQLTIHIYRKAYHQNNLLIQCLGRTQMPETCQKEIESSASNFQPAQTQKINNNIAAVAKVQKYGCLTLFYTNSQTNIIRKLRYQQRFRQTERQIIANALCTKDYKVVILQLQISHSAVNEKMDKSRYKTIAKSIINQAFRQLQRFLKQHCNKQITLLTKNQFQAISKYLLNPRALLSFDQSVTFCAFIRIIFGFTSITMSEYYAAQLYAGVMKILLQCIQRNEVQAQSPEPYHPPIAGKGVFEELMPKSNKKHSQTKELNHKWNNKFEQLLIQHVKYNQNRFVKIRDSFKLKFPQSKDLFTVQSLRNRFYRILRVGVKKFKAIVDSYRDRLPQMILLDDNRAKNIILSAAGAALKLQLLQIYQMSETKIDLPVIANTIQRVNQFVITRQKDITYTAKEVGEQKWGYEIDYKGLQQVSDDS